MRTTRDHEKLEAHRLLDLVRAGMDVPDTAVLWALLTLGDAL